MTHTRHKTDTVLQLTLQELKKHAIEKNAGLWKRVASDLEKPTRQRRIVNVYTIDQNTKENEIVVIPGKVLANGALTHKVHVAAWAFSATAKEKIEAAKGTCLSLQELMKKYPDGKNVRIIG